MSKSFNQKTMGIILLLLALLSYGLTSCDSSYHYEPPTINGIEYNPSLPITISEILPDSGGYKTTFVIKGSNFGTDPSKIRVTFNGNRRATVVSSDGEVIYGLVPKQENGNNKVTVQVDSTKEPAVCPTTFRYTKVERISVLAGKVGTFGDTDGNLIDSRFRYMYGVGVVAGNNLIVMEGRDNRVRMVSENDNKVTTLFTGANFGHPAVTRDRKRAYAIQLTRPHQVYYFDQANSWNAKRLVSSLEGVDGDIYACAFADDDRYLYFRDHQGKFGYFDVQNPEKVTILNEHCGDVDKNVSYLAWSPIDKCFYLSVQNKQGIYKVSKDGKSVEQWVGFGGVGSQDGPRMTATLANPTGMAFDVDGNMYWIDSYAYTIRKLSHADGMVTTVAGKYRSSDNNKVEGLPEDVTFNYPYDIAVDDTGDFYIIEGWGGDVRKFAIE
jgi:hypothetical protein